MGPIVIPDILQILAHFLKEPKFLKAIGSKSVVIALMSLSFNSLHCKFHLLSKKTIRFKNELKVPFNILEEIDQRKYDLAMT